MQHNPNPEDPSENKSEYIFCQAAQADNGLSVVMASYLTWCDANCGGIEP